MNDDIFASVINNTQAARTPVVVGENHDLDSINTSGMGGGSVSKPSDAIRNRIADISRGGWDEAEYGISRSAQIAELEKELARVVAYEATPEGIEAAKKAAEDALKAVRDRAIRRASLDTSAGKVAVMVAGEAPWHGLGVNVSAAVDSTQAIRLASLDWAVKKQQLYYADPTKANAAAEAGGQFGIVRQDTGAFLGAVGSRYEPFQNTDAFAFLDKVIGQYGARYESAGAIYGGAKIWLLAHLPQMAFCVNGTDRVEPYVLFTNSHDGSGVARCFPTTHRVVCANTFRLAQGDRDDGIAIRHTGDLAAKVKAAQDALGLTVTRTAEFRDAAEVLARTRVEPEPYFEGLLDCVCELTQAKADMGVDALVADALATTVAVTQAQRDFERRRFERAIKHRETLLEELCTRYDSEKNGVAGMRGTGWAAFNAVTEAADHGKLGGRTVGADKASRRFESVIDGAADAVKQIAYEQVLAYAK